MEEVLRKLADRLGEQGGEPVALSGGITNRNYRVRFGEADYVVRMCGRDTALLGIDREAERDAGRAACEAGVAPEVVAFLAEDDCLVTAFVAAEPLEPADVADDVARVAAALRAVHRARGVRAAFSPFRVGERYRELTLERGGPLPAAADEALRAAARIERALPPANPVLCHNDLLAANILDDGRAPIAEGDWSGLWIIDWEYAGMGDPCFDLGNLSVNNGFGLDDDVHLVEAYLGRPDEELLARLRVMRAVSEYREGMWGTVQQVLSDLEFDFAGYAEEHLERMLDSDWEDWADAAAA